MIIQGTNISFTRGDSKSIVVKCKENNVDVPFKEGDTIYFTVKESIYTERKILQKIITEFDEGKAIIKIEPDDTKSLKFKKYVYDIQLTRVNGRVITIIKPSDLSITGEVTYE